MRAPKKILLVDDDRRNIFALNAVLKARGFTCETASNAYEGLKKLSSDNDIGIILLDIMMPGMDGFEAIASIRSNPLTASIPVIAVTAQAMAGDKERCLAAGANGYISKPVDVDLLMELLTIYMN